MILHDSLLVVYEVTKLVQDFHAKVIKVKKAFRLWLNLNCRIPYSIRVHINEFYGNILVYKLYAIVQWQHNVFSKVEVQMVALKYIDIC